MKGARAAVRRGDGTTPAASPRVNDLTFERMSALSCATRAPLQASPRISRRVDERAILDVLEAGVIAIRADGIVSTVNPHAARILGLPERDIEGAPIEAVLAPLSSLLTATAHPSGRGELVTQRRDGASVAVGFTLSGPRPMPSGEHYVLLFQDITAVLALREERDRLLQMAVLGEVVPSLLHELRNPLAAVTAMLEILVEDASPGDEVDLRTILGELRRMALGLQGLGGGVSTLRSTTHHAVDLAVREACRLLEPTAARRGVTLLATGPDLPLLAIDRGTICGVVFNLAKNAIEACEEGGTVRVDAALDDDALLLCVHDDGAGMGPDVAARCREPFFTTKEMGSGVGLALAAAVAEASGGVLTIASTAGLGTVVTVRVPLAAKPIC